MYITQHQVLRTQKPPPDAASKSFAKIAAAPQLLAPISLQRLFKQSTPASAPTRVLTTRRTRILYIDHTASLSGGELALLNLIQHLDQTRFKPIVLLFSDGPLADRLRKLRIETYVLPLSPKVLKAPKDSLGLSTFFRVSIPFRTLAHVLRVARFIRKQQIDIVHTNSLKSDIIGGLAGRLANRRVIWHVRDRIDKDYLPTRVVSMFRFLSRRIPNFVITNSQATLATLQPLKPVATSSAGSTRVVYSGVVCPPTTAARPRQRSANSVIGLVGRISPWKGQHIFLQAAAIVRQRFPNARFQIIGASLFAEHEYETKIRTLASELLLNDIVEFTGFRSDVPRLITNLDVLVHASTLAEPFGQVVIEGMAAGKPVIATNGGGVPEIIADGETGLLVPMGDIFAMADAISRLLSDANFSQEIGRRGRQRVLDCFTIQRTARRIEQIYRLILGPPRIAAS